MSLEALERREFETSLGVVPLWSPPGTLGSTRPIIMAITGAFASADTMTKLARAVTPAADACLMHLPGNHTPTLRETSIDAFARAAGEVIEGLLADRPVVLLGISVGALVALGVKAPQVRRIIAVEPPLSTAKLWPFLGAVRAKLTAEPDDAGLRAFAWQVLGVSETTVEDRRGERLFDGLAVPVDVVLGETPLYPVRPLKTYPSFVDDPERAFMATRPGVSLHVAPDAGHNVPGAAPFALRDVLLNACRAAAAPPTVPIWRVDQTLLAAIPLTARRVLALGDVGSALEDAYRRRNPACAPFLRGAAAEGSVDTLLVGADALADVGRLDAGLGSLEDGGWLVAAAPGEAAERLRADLSGRGLTLAPDKSDVEPGRRRAVRARKSGAAVRPLHLLMTVFAPRLMDIRTRLPIAWLGADPELATRAQAPANPPPMPLDTPKVLVLQRPALLELEQWRRATAHHIAHGWVVVLEYDDHPALVTAVKGVTAGEAHWRRFGYVHAVQTSTPRLAEAFGAWNPEVRVFPNAVFELAPFPEFERPRRVFYGAVSRGRFAVDIAASLAPVVRRFPEVEFVVVADKAVFDALPTGNKTFHDYLTYEDYLDVMATCSVSLSPIEGLAHQDTKSDAKFLDASRAGVLTIGSPTIYGEVIEHGVNGLIAPTPADWAPLLIQALEDEPARRGMARRAWEYVRDRRMFAAQAPQRRDWYRDLWARRAKIEIGLMQRLPGLAEALAAFRGG